MSAACTCPEVDPVKRATTYTAFMGVEPHAVTCPRNGCRIVEPSETTMSADIAARAQRLRHDWDESRELGDFHLREVHRLQVRADAARAAALKLRAEHPDHPDLEWLEGDHHA